MNHTPPKNPLRLRLRLLNSGYQINNYEDNLVRVVSKVHVFQCSHEIGLSKCDQDKDVGLTFA